MKRRITTIIFALGLSLGLAPSVLAQLKVRVSQESYAGANDFNDHVLGFIQVFNRPAQTAPEVYGYTGSTYDGQAFGGPPSLVNTSQLFVVNTSQGPTLFVVHDGRSNSDGGRAKMRFDLLGDPNGAARLVEDDPSDLNLTGNSGLPLLGGTGTLFQTHHHWDPCCTDGVVIGALEGPWQILGQFANVDGNPNTDVVAGLTSWQATSADGMNIPFVLVAGRRVRLEAVFSVPVSVNAIVSGTLSTAGVCNIDGVPVKDLTVQVGPSPRVIFSTIDVVLSLDAYGFPTGEFTATLQGSAPITQTFVFSGVRNDGAMTPFGPETVTTPATLTFDVFFSNVGGSTTFSAAFPVFGPSFILSSLGVNSGPWTLVPAGPSTGATIQPIGNFPTEPGSLNIVSLGSTPQQLTLGNSNCAITGTTSSGSGTVSPGPGGLVVPIDIKPGSFPNSINLGSSGVIPVAILGSPGFDVSIIDQSSLQLAGASVSVKGKSGNLCSVEDVNFDSVPDLVCHFVNNLAASPGDTFAALTGQTNESPRRTFAGVDSIRIVP